MDWTVFAAILLIIVVVFLLYCNKSNALKPELKEIANYQIVTINETHTPVEKWVYFIKNYAHSIYQVGGFSEEALALWKIAGESDQPLLVLVMGEFKTGKSTFINTLLGEDVLVSDVAPATAVVTLLKFGPRKKVVLHYNDGQVQNYPYEKLSEITAEGNDEKQELREKLSYVEVAYPNKLLEKINLVDTPGLNVHKEKHIQSTTDFQQKADIVLWVFNAARNASRTEMEEIRSLGERLKPIAIVNRIDLIDEEEESIEEVLGSVRSRLGEAVQKVYGVSSLMARRALQNKREDILNQSGWTDLWKEINAQIVNKSEELKLSSIKNKVQMFSLLFNNSIHNQEVKVQERDKYFLNQTETKRNLSDKISTLERSFQSMEDALNQIDAAHKGYMGTVYRFTRKDFGEEEKFRSWMNTILNCSDNYYNTMEVLKTCDENEELLNNMQMYYSYKQKNSHEFTNWFPKRRPLIMESMYLSEDYERIEQEQYIYEHSGIFGGTPITDFSGKRKRLNAHIKDYNQRRNDLLLNMDSLVRKYVNICRSELQQDIEIKKQITKIQKLYKKEQTKYQKELVNIDKNFNAEKAKHEQKRAQVNSARVIFNSLQNYIK